MNYIAALLLCWYLYLLQQMLALKINYNFQHSFSIYKMVCAERYLYPSILFNLNMSKEGDSKSSPGNLPHQFIDSETPRLEKTSRLI